MCGYDVHCRDTACPWIYKTGVCSLLSCVTRFSSQLHDPDLSELVWFLSCLAWPSEQNILELCLGDVKCLWVIKILLKLCSLPHCLI